MELKISKFLRYGVFVAGALIAIGWLIGFKFSTPVFVKYQVYEQIPLQNFLTYYWNQKDWGMILAYVGLVTLISLPVLRVFFTGLLFIHQKDYLLAMISGMVLMGLLLSFTFGITH